MVMKVSLDIGYFTVREFIVQVKVKVKVEFIMNFNFRMKDNLQFLQDGIFPTIFYKILVTRKGY